VEDKNVPDDNTLVNKVEINLTMLGALVGTLQIGYPFIQVSSQDKQQDVYPHSATCPTAPDLASRLKWAPALPRVLWLRTLSPD
jgi:hypothetical protein